LSIVGTLAVASNANADEGTSRPRSSHRLRSSVLDQPIVTTAGGGGSGVDMQYFGGHVISHVEIVAVMWTSNVYSKIQSQVDGFYQALVDSTYMDWLGEYDTKGVQTYDGKAGTSQHIGHGTFLKTVTITPSSTKTTVTDSQIGQELAAQISAGTLPAPSVDKEGGVNTLYMVYFPPGVVIEDSQGGVSCNGGGGQQVFCGYHSAYSDTVGNVPYAVIPDLSSNACVQGCGAGNAMDDYGIAASHEMVEAITDTEVGTGSGLGVGRPMAWYDTNQGEVGDICANQQDFTATIGGYTIQKIWSQRVGDCIAEDTSLGACDGSTRPCKACTATSCSGAKSICDNETGTCRGCASDADCSGGGTCDTTSGNCQTKSGGSSGGSGSTGGSGSGSGSAGGSGGTNGGTGGSSGGTGGSGGGFGSGSDGQSGSGGQNASNGDAPGDSTTTQTGGCAMGGANQGASDASETGLALFLGLLALARTSQRRRARR
jgi:hypothetical protein